MTFKEIHEKITMGQYNHPRFEVTPKLSSSYIIDENQTVVWNGEEVRKLNEERQNLLDKYKAACNEVDKKFDKDCISAVMREISVTRKSASKIYQEACEDGHANGYHEVYYRLKELFYLILKILIEEKCK